MASSNFTPKLGLSNWAAGDRPKRADFVSDNGIIDKVLGTHIADTAMHMSAEEKDKALLPVESFIYGGTGDAVRTILTGFRPSFAIVFKRGEPQIRLAGGVTIVNSGYASYSQGGTAGVGITSNGVQVQQEAAASDGQRISLNEEGCQYTLIAFK